MNQKHKTFNPSFKLQVFEMTRDRGLRVEQVCRDTRLGEMAVRRWVRSMLRNDPGRRAQGPAALSARPGTPRTRNSPGGAGLYTVT